MRKRQRSSLEVVLLPLLVIYISENVHCVKSILFNVPQRFIPGKPLHAAVTLLSVSPRASTVRVSLLALTNSTSEIVTTDANLEPGDTKLLKLQVPENLPDVDRFSFLVYSITGNTFVSSRSIKPDRTVSTALVQTDRPMYKPGQKVLFRVLHLNKGLKLSREPLIVTILDPANLKVEMFSKVTSKNGVTSLEFQLPSSSTPGRWRISVERDLNGIKTKIAFKHFIVEEFVNPAFEVDVIADPGYIVLNSREKPPLIVVKALYTFGKGVKGNCQLIVKQKDTNLAIFLEGELNESGMVEFPSTVFSSLTSTKDVILTAQVTDSAGRAGNSSALVKVFTSNIRIQILKRTTKELKLGIPAVVAIRLTDQLDRPLDTSNVVKVEIKGPSLEAEEMYMFVAAGESDSIMTYTPTRKMGSTDEGLLTVQLKEDPDVQAVAKLIVYNRFKRQQAISINLAENTNVSIGSEVELGVRYVRPLETSNITLHYVIANQQNILEAKKINDSLITVLVSEDFCPGAAVIVFMSYSETNGETNEVFNEIDRQELIPTNCFPTEVDISFESEIARTGTSTNMHISVSDSLSGQQIPGVFDIFYMAVDKRTTLLRGGTALNLNTLNAAMETKRSNADGIITLVGNIAKTRLLRSNLRSIQTGEADEVSDDPESGLQIRKDFPDTWLWGQASTESSGKLVQTVILPDTITSWEVSAFAVSERGISVTREPIQLTAFQRFFLSMNLPYSVKRSEVFQLKITVFNYKKSKVKAIVAIHEGAEFVVLGGTNKDGWYETLTMIDADSASTVHFRIGVVKAGLIQLKAKATDQSDGDHDEVHRDLLVKHDGVERIGLTNKVMVIARDNQDVTETFDIPWPQEGISSGSQRVEVKVTGELFGQALPNLDRLVVVPTGCGEQTMMKMAPNIFGLTYIEARQLVDFDKLVAGMTLNMRTGYFRQISKYRHDDGSYSVWGPKRSNSGSTWLTAFVIKCFTRAADYIPLDETIINTGVSFLKKKQTSSGGFIEEGNVVHQEFLPSKKSSEVTLTSYVLISILEAPKRYRDKVQDVIDRAVSYILTSIDLSRLDGTSRSLASIAYALSLLPDRTLQGANLMDKLIYYVIDVNPQWQSKDVAVMQTGAKRKQFSPAELEAAAYVLLALTRLGRLGEGFQLMEWLNSQQNHRGGFKSTQDTVMVLQALSEFGLVYESDRGRGQVTVEELSGPNSSASFTIDISGPRAALLQTVELSSDTQQVKITLNGDKNTMAMIKIVHFYHEVTGETPRWDSVQDISLNISTTSERESRTVQRIQTCVQSSSPGGDNLTSGTEGMYVATLFLPSGEMVFDSAVSIQAQNPAAALVETLDGNIHFYLPEPPTTPQCLVARVERQLEFEVQKPGYARVYPYYNPDLMNETTLAMAPLSDLACYADQCRADNVRGGATFYDVTNALLTMIACVLSSIMLCL